MGDGVVRCRRCSRVLTALDSVAYGFGPECVVVLGIDVTAMLPQRCRCCWLSQEALRLLAGLPVTYVPVRRFDGSPGWLDTATGEVLPRLLAAAA